MKLNLNQRARWVRAILSLLPLLLFALLGEAASRIICHLRFSPYHTHFSVMGNGRWADSDFTVWTNRPRFLEHTLQSQYNDLGFRVAPGDVTMPEKGADDFWVILLGGSTVGGMGSSQNRDWLKITGVGTHPIDESIDGYLESILRQGFPTKNVRVFNAAISSARALQSRLRYKELRRLRPDWVVSIDGVNDRLGEGKTTQEVIEEYWANHRFKRFPYREFRAAMRNSALLFLIGEYVYAKSGLIQTPVTSRQDEDVYRKWLRVPVATNPAPPTDEHTVRSQRALLAHLRGLDRDLNADGVPHLLLVQPHLSLRDTSRLFGVEKAVYNCYMARSAQNGFLLGAHQSLPVGKRIRSMESMHGWSGQVFVDYCHFTREANKRVAEEIGRHIMSAGEYEPFDK